MGLDLDLIAIREDLALLRASSSRVKIFGAEAHGFVTHPPLSEELVQAFERQHSVQLPADYRGFLIHVGNGGAGPTWGLFKLGEMDNAFKHKRWKENDGFVGTLAKPFPHVSSWNDSGGHPEYDESKQDDPQYEAEYEAQLNDWEKVYWSRDNVNGAIPICHLGCAQRQWLVVSGAEAGHVWDDCRPDLAGLKPLTQMGRERVTFLQWYRDWLDEALKAVRAGV